MYTFQDVVTDKVTSWELKEKGKKFIAATNLEQLSKFLGKNMEQLANLVQNPQYTQFYVPKRNGGKRLIETPGMELQKLLRKLNPYLQAAYHPIKPDCAYGSIRSTADEKTPRNIYTNAMRHVDKKWLLGLDVKDFFHSISWEQVYSMFRKMPFSFKEDAADMLAHLTTYENRLPIGCSTSPTIANLICLNLDKKLEKITQKSYMVYTRFMDDMTFSSQKRIGKKLAQKLFKAIEEEGFSINEEKTEYSRIKDEPVVTGLILKEGKPDIPEDFIKDLEKDISIYHRLTSAQFLIKNIFPSHLLKRLRNHLAGQVNFVKFIRGGSHISYIRLKGKLFPDSLSFS